MLNKNNFVIGKLAPVPVKDGDNKLCCVQVRPDKTAVTNGSYVIEVSGAEYKEKLLPFDDVMPSDDFEAFTMPADEAIALSKVFVKAETTDGNILAVQPDNGKGVSAFALRQSRREKIFKTDRPGAGFPNYEVIFDKMENELGYVTVDLNYLIPLLSCMKMVSGGPVRIALYGPESPIRIDCIDPDTNQSVRAAIMPMKA